MFQFFSRGTQGGDPEIFPLCHAKHSVISYQVYPYSTFPYLLLVPGVSLCSFSRGTQGGDPVNSRISYFELFLYLMRSTWYSIISYEYPSLSDMPVSHTGTWYFFVQFFSRYSGWGPGRIPLSGNPSSHTRYLVQYLIFSFCSFSLGTQGGDLVVYPYLTFPYIILVPGISLCSFSRGTQDGDPINSLISYPFLSCEAFHYLVYPYLTFPYLWYFFVQFFSRHSGWGPVISV